MGTIYSYLFQLQHKVVEKLIHQGVNAVGLSVGTCA